VPASDTHNSIFYWMTKGWESVGNEPHPDPALRLIWAFERVRLATTEDEVVKLILDYDLPREALPTKWLTSRRVWEALLRNMPITAMIRNLSVMTNVGLISVLSDGTRIVCDRLQSQTLLRRARVHPIAILAAIGGYNQNQAAVTRVKNALDDAFYLAFGNVEPTGQRTLLALDVSGSMGSIMPGMTGISAREASVAMALVTARREPHHAFIAFTSQYRTIRDAVSGVEPIDVSPKDTLRTAMQKTASLPFGGTDCALPMLWATKNRTPVDKFVIYTDNETWAGSVKPSTALREYKSTMGINAKLVVVGMTATNFSIADPDDPGMLDVVGFDTSAPQVISDF
jgi:60 kDa SS-A/Ro ribonucleoprotein